VGIRKPKRQIGVILVLKEGTEGVIAPIAFRNQARVKSEEKMSLVAIGEGTRNGSVEPLSGNIKVLLVLKISKNGRELKGTQTKTRNWYLH
jgi:hypothetical protein